MYLSLPLLSAGSCFCFGVVSEHKENAMSSSSISRGWRRRMSSVNGGDRE